MLSSPSCANAAGAAAISIRPTVANVRATELAAPGRRERITRNERISLPPRASIAWIVRLFLLQSEFRHRSTDATRSRGKPLGVSDTEGRRQRRRAGSPQEHGR